MDFIEIGVIIALLLAVVYILNINKAAGFWSDRGNPDEVLESYTNRSKNMQRSHIQKLPFLPSNKIILKGHSSEYWDCYEMNKALGSSPNEILSKCSEFVNSR